MPKKLYALLVGIDNYPHTSALEGCVNDVKRMKSYLETKRNEEFDLNIKTLLEEEATKENIISTFRSHLGQAESGDITLFLFAGHGVEEVTPYPVFQKASATRNMQTFYCWNTKTLKPHEVPEEGSDPAKTTLADKELRYLIHELSKKNSDLYVIIDCCHSGGMSRLGDKCRQISDKPIGHRKYEGFFFHEEISEKELKNEQNSLADLIPLADQVQMSACRDIELAWEHADDNFKKGGLFSITLMRILEKAGPEISIYRLNDQIVNYLRGYKKKEQTPQMFIKSDDPAKQYKGFLGVELKPQPYKTQIVKNIVKGWVLGMGSIHGIQPRAGEKFTISVVVDEETGEEKEVALTKITPVYSILDKEVVKSWNLDEGRSYPCHVNISVEPLRLYIDAPSQTRAFIMEELKKKMLEKNTEYLAFVTDENDAQYTLRLIDEKHEDPTRQYYIFTLPNHQRRILKKSFIRENSDPEKNGIETMFIYLVHIAKREFVRKSKSPNDNLARGLPSELNGRPIQMTFFVQDKDGNKKVLPNDKSITFDLDKTKIVDGVEKPYNKFGFSLTNHHPTKELVVRLLYLQMNYSVISIPLSNDGFLRPGETLHFKDGGYVNVKQDDFIEIDNWKGQTNYFKLIACTSKFDPSPLELDKLPLPYESGNRGIEFEEADVPEEDNWITYETEVFITNPKYDITKEPELQVEEA